MTSIAVRVMPGPNSWLVINQERTPADKAITPHYDPADVRRLYLDPIPWMSHSMHPMTRRHASRGWLLLLEATSVSSAQ